MLFAGEEEMVTVFTEVASRVQSASNLDLNHNSCCLVMSVDSFSPWPISVAWVAMVKKK